MINTKGILSGTSHILKSDGPAVFDGPAAEAAGEDTRVALVTGSTSGFGRAIALRLLKEGFRVYGIGRNSAGAPTHESFIFLEADLRDEKAIANIVSELPKPLALLVNAAGVAYYGPHETLSPDSIAEMVEVNVTAPMILANLLLPSLRSCCGTILNVSSVTAKQNSNTHGCAYGATKAALSSFSESLFAECRRSGVRVLTLHPDLADTALYRYADFTPDPAPDSCLSAEEVAEAAWLMCSARDGLAVTDVTLRPQRNRIIRKTNSTES
ncbi:MAG: SDR family oxidoreductase [Lachnospiraceae bacterium]|nr:SDR family oxidoreductase [Lachnospiraceae bacterium]